MTRFAIYPNAMSSMSSRDLAIKLREQGFDALRVYPDRNYRPRQGDIIINWGNSHIPNWGWSIDFAWATFVNHPKYVELSINKIKSFERMQEQGVSVPLSTTIMNEAKEWARDGVISPIVVCRTLVSAHAGRGIVIATNPDEVVEAPLYTKHVRHKREFRVHILNGRVIDFTEKKKAIDREVLNDYVRNHGNGWVFCRENIDLPEDCKLQAINAVRALGLNFGAVDIAYREREDKAFVLEVNTAPGFDIESTTLKRYVEAFIREYT